MIHALIIDLKSTSFYICPLNRSLPSSVNFIHSIERRSIRHSVCSCLYD